MSKSMMCIDNNDSEINKQTHTHTRNHFHGGMDAPHAVFKTLYHRLEKVYSASHISGVYAHPLNKQTHYEAPSR